VARYARRVHDLARRILRDPVEAEDAAQHAFLNAFRALDRFDPRRPFRHWLLRITTNLCRNRLVARAHRPMPLGVGAEDDDRPSLVPAAPTADDPPDDRPDTAQVRAALEALPETYRTAAVLRYVHGLDLAAIAEITDVPLPTVKTHLHRARAALARRLVPPRIPPETPPPRAGTTP
jgi:RNA polymerase sigma-70 factor (ECF subfamily)